MSDQWPSKKEYEQVVRQINLRLDSLLAGAVAGGGNMVYTTAASHTHSGGGAYETVLNIAATHKGQALVFLSGDFNASAGYHTLQVTVDGVIVLADLKAVIPRYDGPIMYGGIWNFDVSLKIEHKSDKAIAICKVAYCSV